MTTKENLKIRKMLEIKKNTAKAAYNACRDESKIEELDAAWMKAADEYYDFCRENPTPTERRIESNRRFRRTCGLID